MSDTFYASPERTDSFELKLEIDLVTKNPIVDGLLGTVNGLLAVVNKDRQIVSINKSLLESLGFSNIEEAMGLRPGEAIKCIHAHEEPAGCGTTKYCSSCGAAIAMVTCLNNNEIVERKCVATVRNNGSTADLCLSVRACPIEIAGHRFMLLFLQDITQIEERTMLDQTFYHDIFNLITCLTGVSEMMDSSVSDPKVADYLRTLCMRLKHEVLMQKAIKLSDATEYKAALDTLKTSSVIAELKEMFESYKSVMGISLEIPDNMPDIELKSDMDLILRILSNMLKNAFEASVDGDVVRLCVTTEGQEAVFSVWNRRSIPEPIANRVFQRYFSTKSENGRGFGTYSMKLFGEKVLGGQVDFKTSEADGTVFTFRLKA